MNNLEQKIIEESTNSKIIQEFRQWIFDNTSNVQLPDGTSYTEQKLNIMDFESFLLKVIKQVRAEIERNLYQVIEDAYTECDGSAGEMFDYIQEGLSKLRDGKEKRRLKNHEKRFKGII